MTKICANPECGKEFGFIKFSSLLQKYCSKKCQKAHNGRMWWDNNPDKRREAGTCRRALKSGTQGDHYTASQFRDLCNRFDNICLCCREKKKLTADHVIPLSKGGPDSIDNIQPLCGQCNSGKGARTVDYRVAI